MNKYLVLYHAPKAAHGQMMKAPPEMAKAGMEMWTAWAQRLGSSLVDGGAPLGESESIGGKPADPEMIVGGYSVIEAASLDAAKKLMDGHPHFHMPGGWIELLDFVRLPGM